jgi:L-fuculose-phosphate aldolase
MMFTLGKKSLVAYGRNLVTRRLTTGSGGNLSVIDRQEGRVAITPSGMDYFGITEDDIVVTDLDGVRLDGDRAPSSELAFHLALYHHRADIRAVVHTHSVYATTLACLHREIPAVHYLVGFAGHDVPLAPYATFGTAALSEAIRATIGDRNAVLLANHGLVAVGATLKEAFNTAEEIEFVARVYYQTLTVGTPKLLSREQMDDVLVRFKSYGRQPSPEPPPETQTDR